MRTMTCTTAASIRNASLVNLQQGFSTASGCREVMDRWVAHAVSTIQTFIDPYGTDCTDLWHAVNSRILKHSVNLITLLCTELFSKT